MPYSYDLQSTTSVFCSRACNLYCRINSYLQSLEKRRLTADLILTYKIIFGLVDVCMSDYFQLMSTDGDRIP